MSVTPSYVSGQLRSGTQTGKLLQKYKEDIDRPLSAILTLNTIAHTVGAIGVGAMAGEVFGQNNVDLGIISLSSESIIATVMTLAVLILSEIIPKTIGANNWQALSPFTVRTLSILIFLLTPLVWVSQQITKKLKKDKKKSVLSRADFMAMATAVEDSGALAKDESAIIKNVLNFESKTVMDIMTPRKVAFMVQEDTTIEDFLAMPNATTYSRVPIFGADKDSVSGIVLKDDILLATVKGEKSTLKEMVRPANIVPSSMSLTELFDKLSKDRQHLYMVSDEFGQILGLVTLEDVFETLLGKEILDESDQVADLQEHAREKWAKDK